MSDRDAKSKQDKESYRRYLPGRSEIDEIIQDAMAQGKFENLRGKGKPLKLSNNPFTAETELAYNLLKQNDYTLPWIAGRTEMLAEIATFRAEVARLWQLYSSEYRAAPSEPHRAAISLEWSRQQGRWQEAILALNKKIEAVNLKQPLQRLEIYKLTLDGELKRAGAEAVIRDP